MSKLKTAFGAKSLRIDVISQMLSTELHTFILALISIRKDEGDRRMKTSALTVVDGGVFNQLNIKMLSQRLEA
jgi:hypothetical protein